MARSAGDPERGADQPDPADGSSRGPVELGGAAQHVERRPGIAADAENRYVDAAVKAIRTPVVTVRTIPYMRRVAGAQSGNLILTPDEPSDANLVAAAEVGVTSMFWRSETTAGHFAEAIVTVSRNDVDPPPEGPDRVVVDVAAARRGRPWVGTPERLTFCSTSQSNWAASTIAQNGLDSKQTIHGRLRRPESPPESACSLAPGRPGPPGPGSSDPGRIEIITDRRIWGY